MPLGTLLKQTEKFEIEKYRKPKDPKILVGSHMPYSGSPHKHPYDKNKMILVVDPYYAPTFYYEFKKNDIAFIEELPNLVNLEGEIFTMVRIWVKKMSVAVRSTPFIVGDMQG